MITDRRHVCGENDFPFLFVQSTPYNGMTPEIREAQLFAMQRTKNTAMALTVDCGDANAIHPAHNCHANRTVSVASADLQAEAGISADAT